ncbi:Long-chain-fatty-acid--CoA ligase [Mycobacterium marinum str. Europe]|nr:Long-chain-fatty-acid--CoA ligase [Mycobacterium marinum str. Europe]
MRQLTGHLEGGRNFEGRQLLPAEFGEFLRSGRGLTRHDHRRDRFPVERVGDAEDRVLQHPGVAGQHPFDAFRGNLLPAPVDQFLDPAADAEVARLRQGSEVAGA